MFTACASDSGPGSEKALRDQRWREVIAERTPLPDLCENMQLIANGEEPTQSVGLVGFDPAGMDWPSREVAREFVQELC